MSFAHYAIRAQSTPVFLNSHWCSFLAQTWKRLLGGNFNRFIKRGEQDAHINSKLWYSNWRSSLDHSYTPNWSMNAAPKCTYIYIHTHIYTYTYIFNGFPGDSDDKEPACNVGDRGSVPGLGRCPGGGHGNPLQYSWLENPHGQNSLAGCSPLDRKESDTTEWLSTYK